MQLIFNTDTDIGIQKKMSAIQQESLEEKFINKSLIHKIGSGIDDNPHGKDSCGNIKGIIELCNGTEKIKSNEQVTNETESNSDSLVITNREENKEENVKDSSKNEVTEYVEKMDKIVKGHINLEENQETSALEQIKNKSGEENKEIELKKNKVSEEIFEVECQQKERVAEESNKVDTAEIFNISAKNETEELHKKDVTNDTKNNEVKEKILKFIESNKFKDEMKDDNLTTLANKINLVDKNKDIDEDGNKENDKNGQKQAISVVENMEIHQQSLENKESVNFCSLGNNDDKQNTDINCDTNATVELEGTTSGKSMDINDKNKIIIEEKQEENNDNEKSLDNKMEIDDTTLIDNKKEISVVDNCKHGVNNPVIFNMKEVMIDHKETEEIINIADEKDEDYKNEAIEKTSLNQQDVSNVQIDPSAQKAKNHTHHSNNQEIPVSSSEEHDNLKAKEQLGSEKNVVEKRNFTQVSRLSNTLDILSDDEDPPKDEFPKQIQNTAAVDKQCINLEDDDDIMLIDEETNTSCSENKTENIIDPRANLLKNEDFVEECVQDKNKPPEMPQDIKVSDNSEANLVVDANESKQEANIPEESKPQLKPLLPVNFLKTCKKNFGDMTRDELEEFCILKIVESVVDRGNLSEIKSQLKTMAQTIDEYKKKASMLTKQNRELQVVLKSVQEEQKKKPDAPITPLKITRSVGIQVLMTEKTGVRRKPLQGTNNLQNNVVSNNPTPRSSKSQMNQNSRLTKINSNTSPAIPVPRLVPAVNNSNLNNIKIQTTNANSPGKSILTNVPNGPSSLPTAQKPEKRPHSRIQQNNSVTVDLTDDEPPSKIIQRNTTPPVRLVNPQNLLAPHRQPFGTSINSPRKVYIPISGSQNQSVRPGQTIMLKAISPQGPRQRCVAPTVSKPNQTATAVRMQRLSNRHPAPLPDSMKQYQPPNWKALPPAPELKLSKVENGIVISWKIDGYQEENHEDIASYQLYAYQETSSPPSTALWKKIGDVKALPLPMACTLTQFMAGYKYYFAVRAVDVRSRLGPFSLPGSILLLNKM